MMTIRHSFGDGPDPDPDSAHLIEEVVRQQMKSLVSISHTFTHSEHYPHQDGIMTFE